MQFLSFFAYPYYMVRRSRQQGLLCRPENILRTTFEQLEVLDYQPTYDHCVQVVRNTLERCR